MESKYCDVKISIRELLSFNNKELRLTSSKFDTSVLDLTLIQSHWYVDIFFLHTNNSSFAIGSSVLMIYNISRKVSYMKYTRIVPNTNLLKYIIPHLMHAVIFCGTQAEPCQFETHKSFQG